MNATFRFAFACKAVFLLCLLILQAGTPSWGESYDLSKVNGIQAFGGSPAAKKLLSQNGFVVADPPFKKIFEASYIKSPQT